MILRRDTEYLDGRGALLSRVLVENVANRFTDAGVAEDLDGA